MKTAAVSTCTNGGLTVTGTLDDTTTPASDPSKLARPTGSDIGTVSFNLGDKPTVTGAPAVIEGEVQ